MDDQIKRIQKELDSLRKQRKQLLEVFRLPFHYMSPRLVWYRYCWRNNVKRLQLFGRKCRILAQGNRNSVLIEFENGDKEIVSRRALRRI